MVRPSFWIVGVSCMAMFHLVARRVQAHSTLSGPLSRVELITSPSLHILPRDPNLPSTLRRRSSDLTPNPSYAHPHRALESEDSFRLRFTAFNTTFNLHLVPNLELFHPHATLTVVDEDGEETVSPLNHDDFRIYRGVVIDEALTERRLMEDTVGVWRDHYDLDGETQKGVLGWARIVMRHDYSADSPHPVFEGGFSYNQDIYHIKTTHTFRLTKRADDPDPSYPELLSNSHTSMVIFRDSDQIQPSLDSILPHSLNPRGFPDFDFQSLSTPEPTDAACGADELHFNSHPSNPARALRNQRLGVSSVTSPFGGLNPRGVFEEDWPFGIPSHQINRRSTVFGAARGVPAAARFVRRQADTMGCPTGRLINYMGAASDCTYTQFYGSIEAARVQIISDWNLASAVYERTFNISLGLIYLNMMTPACPSTMFIGTNMTWNQNCSDNYTINDRLSDFSIWRGGRGNDDAGLWHLMTKCFTGVKVGIAWLGMLCQTSATVQQASDGTSEYVSGTGVSSITRDEWKVVAHEIGHGFGAIHDCTAQLCPCIGDCGCCPLSANQCDAGGTYIMNPTSNVSTNDFSPCSITDICHAFPTSGFCLQAPGTLQVETLAMCGNGIVEAGEECDPGGTDDACCYAKTCLLKPGAQCDDYNDECCQSCTIRPAMAICRPAQSSCDIAEYCNGTSADCPPDLHVPDKTPCGAGLKCASGQCTSRDAQCQLRGSRLNVVQQCSFQQQSCQISCQDPTDSSGSHCLMLSGNFLDGTDCGFGGTCEKGVCQSAGIVNTALAWLDQNKAIAIPVGILFGLIVCGLICLCLFRCRRRRMINKYKHSRPPSASTPPRSHNNNAYPLSGYPSIASRGSTSWVDASPYNGSAPAPPQPAYSPPRHDHASDASTITPASSGFPADSWNTIGRNSDGSYLLAGSSPSTRGTSSPSRTIHVGAIPSAKTTPARRNNTTIYGGSDNSDQWLSATYESSLPTTSLPLT